MATEAEAYDHTLRSPSSPVYHRRRRTRLRSIVYRLHRKFLRFLAFAGEENCEMNSLNMPPQMFPIDMSSTNDSKKMFFRTVKVKKKKKILRIIVDGSSAAAAAAA